MSEVIGFYGANNPYGEFSNFYTARFVVDGVKFLWAEQFIMYQKAILFGDRKVANQILTVSAPLNAKRLGRQVTPFDSQEWEDKCEGLVLPGLYAKFAQNPKLKEKLLGTGDALLCECSPRDRIWGIGMGISNPLYKDPSCWRGQNRQGHLLIRVRYLLRQEGEKSKVLC